MASNGSTLDEVGVRTKGDGVPLDSASPEDNIKALVAGNTVMVFGESWCPFSIEAVRVLKELGVERSAFCMLDKEPAGSAVRARLREMTNQKTVPYIYINEKFIGGCDNLKTLQYSGALSSMLRSAATVPDVESGRFSGVGGSAVAAGTAPAPMTFFDFPAVVDDRVIRILGCIVFATCVVAAAFFDRVQAQWTMGATMVDYLLRFYGGANISVVGSVAQLIAAAMERFGSKPKWIAGPPKQFASFCGVMFAFLAFLFFQLSQHVAAFKYVGLAFTCGLAGAAGLEGLIGFCLGCWMFGLAIRFGLVSPQVYMVYTSSRDEADYTWHDVNKRLGEARPDATTKTFGGGKQATSIDYRYKAKTVDMTREDFEVVRHTKVAHFGMHMGLAALALVWQLAADVLPGGVSRVVYWAIALGTATLFTMWAVLYLLRALSYPHKIHNEWMDPLRNNFFGAPFVTLMLYAALVAPHSLPLAKVLFWVGAPTTLLLSIIRVGDWIATRKDLEHFNASWLLLPVGNFVAALVGPGLDAAYAPAMQFWFAFALMLWVLLFAATFAKAVLVPDNDDRMRPLLYFWASAPAVASIAYLAAFSPSAADHFFVITHWMGVALVLLLLWGCGRGFFGRPFDMSAWSSSFPLAAVTASCLTYYGMYPGDLSYGIAVAALAAVTSSQFMLLCHTLAAILRRRGVFTPEAKWGPISFVSLTHEAFRAAVPRLLEVAEEVAKGDTAPSTLAVLSERWRLFNLMFCEHSKHEDEIIFKTFDSFFPGSATPYNQEHEKVHALMDRIDAQLTSAGNGKGAASAAAALPDLQELAVSLLLHLRDEEDNISPVGRRYVPLAMHKACIAKVFESTDHAVWYELLPWVVNNLPMHWQRVRYIKTFLWAAPERAQQLGAMVALGVDSVRWALLTAELPEIIPRGAAGWTRYG